MAGIRPPQAYLALDMTDTAPLASLAADLAGGRTSGLRFLDDAGTLALVLGVPGLAEAERQPLEDGLRDALLGREGVTRVGVTMPDARKSGVVGARVRARVDLGGGRDNKKKNQEND